jgi:hypothetical protein
MIQVTERLILRGLIHVDGGETRRDLCKKVHAVPSPFHQGSERIASSLYLWD